METQLSRVVIEKRELFFFFSNIFFNGIWTRFGRLSCCVFPLMLLALQSRVIVSSFYGSDLPLVTQRPSKKAKHCEGKQKTITEPVSRVGFQLHFFPLRWLPDNDRTRLFAVSSSCSYRRFYLTNGVRDPKKRRWLVDLFCFCRLLRSNTNGTSGCCAGPRRRTWRRCRASAASTRAASTNSAGPSSSSSANGSTSTKSTWTKYDHDGHDDHDDATFCFF